ncbi:MAG: hypothetical protein ILP12_04215 [Lachnospiraceae bacterium]|nr:hypothetical protein [Lachnospiraceae bacterium]
MEKQRFLWPTDTLASVSIFQLIYVLLLSRLLTGSPLYGGAMYLVGLGAAALLLNGRQRQSLRSERKNQRWETVLYLVLVAGMLLLAAFLPSQPGPGRVWLLFAAVAAVTFRDVHGFQLTGNYMSGGLDRRAYTIRYWLLQGAMFALAAGLLLPLLWGPAAFVAVAGYLFSTAISVYSHSQLREDARLEWKDAPEAEESIRRVSALKRYETLCFLVNIALQMSMIVLYALLATGETQMLAAFGISFAGLLITRELAEWLLKKTRIETENLLIIALLLWVIAILLFILTLQSAEVNLIAGYGSLLLVTVGSVLSMICLDRLFDRVLGAARFAEVGETELRLRHTGNVGRSCLWGQALALAAISMVIAFLRADVTAGLQFDGELHWQPWLMIAVLLPALAALLGALQFPLTGSYASKLERYRRLKEREEVNDALEAQLRGTLIDNRPRPIIVQIAIRLLRPFLRMKVINARYITADEENPVVFLCNHREYYGPLASVICMPVPVRPWVISKIHDTPEEFAEYFYRYNLADVKWFPEKWKMPLARTIGRASIWLMDQLDAIPVYRDKPSVLIKTMRLSAAALEAGDNILIHPENPNAEYQDAGYHLDGIGPLFDGFPLMAQLYYTHTGKRLTFIPMIVHRASRTMIFGPGITYDPDNASKAERRRISEAASREMHRLYGEAEAQCRKKG